MRLKNVYLAFLGCGLVVFIVIGLAGIGAFFYFGSKVRPGVEMGWSDPASAVKVEKVWPGAALLPLTGVDDITAINRAMSEGELESAFALVVFSNVLSDKERAGTLLLQGQRFSEAGDKAKAMLCYQMINAIAALSPTLSDFERAEAFLQSGQGFFALNRRSEALFSYDQAQTVALYSPYMKKAHRQHILKRLIPAYTALGVGREKWNELEQLIALGGDKEAQNNSENIEEESILTELLNLRAELPEAEEATAGRKRAAQALLENFQARRRSGTESLINDLALAIQVEDAVRLGAYEARFGTTTQLSEKIALARAKVDWLNLKYIVARRACGLSLVPEWEKQAGKIQSELSKAYEELYTLYGEQAVVMPKPDRIDRAWLDILRQEIEFGRLGLYPNYPEKQLIEKLREHTTKLIARAYDHSLRVDTIAGRGAEIFILVPDELYEPR
ncbi:MAG: hypothetical protein ACUVV0_05075 [Anaerolineae bacterium]